MTSSRPPELAAATEQTLTVTGSAVAELVTPGDGISMLDQVAQGFSTAFMTVENITAEANPGVVFDLFLNMPVGLQGSQAEFYYTGSFTLFGIESMNDPDRAHDGASGLRHAFDATAVIRALAQENVWDSSAITVTVEPVPPPGEEFSGVEIPVQVGRIGLFVTPDDSGLVA